MNPAIIPIIVELGREIVSRIPDPARAAEAERALLEKAMDQDFQERLAQLDINKAEAQSSSAFTSGWRPGAGWVCVIGLAYTFLARPLLTWAGGWIGIAAPPPIDNTELMALLGALLGIGTLRSMDKWRGKQS